jgi:site-specific recombinase XerD
MAKKIYFLQALSEFFTVYLPQSKGLSANTIRSYKHCFRLLLKYVNISQGLSPEKIEFHHLEKGVVESWLNWLRNERNCSARTGNHRLSALTTFAKFAVGRDFGNALTFCADVNRVPKLREPRIAEAVHLTREEMSVLLRLPTSRTMTGRRDKVLLSTLYASGARAQELCDIRVGDVKTGVQSTVTLHGKGGKTRTVVIPEQSALLLKNHMERNGLIGVDADKSRHVFSSHTNEHMTVSCIEAIVKKYVKTAKEMRPDLFRENYTPHSFRHYGVRSKMVSEHSDSGKIADSHDERSPFYHLQQSEFKKSIRLLSSDQSGSSPVGSMST